MELLLLDTVTVLLTPGLLVAAEPLVDPADSLIILVSATTTTVSSVRCNFVSITTSVSPTPTTTPITKTHTHTDKGRRVL